MTETTIYPKFRWYVLTTMFMATVAQGMILISPAPLVGEISKSMGLDLGTVTGAAMGAFTLFVALSAIAGGAIVDKFGIVRTYIGSLLLMIIGALLIPMVGESLVALVILRAIQGMGAGPVIATVSKIAAEWFPARERAMVTGVQGMALSLGIAIGFATAPAIFISTSNWQSAMAWMAVAACIAMILTIIMAFGPKSPIDHSAVSHLSDAEKNDFKLALKQPVFWISFLCVFALSWIQQGYNDLTPGHLAVQAPVGLGLGPAVSGQIMGVYQIAFMAGSIVSGFLIQKVFGGRTKPVILFSFLMTAIFCLSVLLPFVYSNMTLLVICLLVAGFFMGMPIPSVMAFIATSYPEHITGKVGGMTMGLGILGGTIGVAAGSIALHTTGMYTVSIIIVGVMGILGLLLGTGVNAPKVFASKGNNVISG